MYDCVWLNIPYKRECCQVFYLPSLVKISQPLRVHLWLVALVVAVSLVELLAAWGGLPPDRLAVWLWIRP